MLYSGPDNKVSLWKRKSWISDFEFTSLILLCGISLQAHTQFVTLSLTLTYISPLSHTDTQQPPSGVWKVYSLVCESTASLLCHCSCWDSLVLFPLFLSSTRSFTFLFFPFHTSSFSCLHLCFSLFFCVIPSVRRCESNSSLLSFTGLKKTVCVCLTLLTRTDRRTSDMSNRRCPPPDIWCLI